MKNIYVHTLASRLLTLTTPQKNKIPKIDPTLTIIIYRSQLVHIGLFGFPESLSPNYAYK